MICQSLHALIVALTRIDIIDADSIRPELLQQGRVNRALLGIGIGQYIDRGVTRGITRVDDA